MAGDVGFLNLMARIEAEPPITMPLHAAESPPHAAMEQWEVSYSRFFNFPRRSSPVANLRPLPKCKIRSTGTWLTASSSAVILLLRRRPASATVLSVSVRGKLYEEHFVSNLHFSWPQVSCVAECPVRGSRAVIVSYRDSSSQIQKFAVRFPTSIAAEAFINLVKDCSREAIDNGHRGSDFVCENSSQSEFIAPNGLHQRYDEESSYQEPIASVAPDMPTLTFNNVESESPLQPLLASNVENIFSGFPPSFTDMLNKCATDSEKDGNARSQSVDGAEFTSQNVGCMQEPSFQNSDATLQEDLMDENFLKAQLARCASDASFHEMLSKIERVIDELGGDLAL